MSRIVLTALILALSANTAHALELSNARVTTGPLGTRRVGDKFLPGDYVFLVFEIRGLKVDPKTGTAVYQTKMEILDGRGKAIFTQIVPPKKIALLGGDSLPSDATAFLGSKQDPGRYKMRITVLDLRANKKDSLDYDFEILPARFAVVQPVCPAVAFAGTDFAVAVGLVNMKRDKEKLPKVTVTMQILDGAGKPVLPKPAKLNVRDLHDPVLNNLAATDVIRISFPIFLNRPARYRFVIEAVDDFTGQRSRQTLFLNVIDSREFGAG